ncbi:MAG TPA: molybdopterin-guanine dinucleotide biosynthesis protein B [Thermoanaerobaculia bacterium]
MSSRRARVRPGLDTLIEDPSPVAGRRFGLVTNQSAVTSAGVPAWRALSTHPDLALVKLFGPEHGVDGGAVYMEAVGDAVHAPTGLPAVSLYGADASSLKPTAPQLEGLDALVFDIPDVGARYYTYNWTMLLAMEACAERGLRMVVCDRPNPLGGGLEGAPQEPGFLSFVGLHPIAVRHGMTAGELARLFAAERGIDLDLVVVPAKGWARNLTFETTGLPWVQPSPNIPTPETARVYPGMCLLEGTNLSEGRGTTRPFEMFGAPWLSALDLADALNALELPGARFLPAHFRPMFEKHAGKTCGGAQIVVTDPFAYRAFETGMRVIEAARRLAPGEFHWRLEPYEFDDRPAIDALTGSDRFRNALDAAADLTAEIARHDRGAREFESRRASYRLYPDRRPAAAAFVGAHDAGKTTLLTELIGRLARRGLSIGAVKHSGKDADDDVAGKDSQRLADAGARIAGFVTPARTSVRRFGPEETFEELIARDFAECDLVLVEGYKSSTLPKVEVRRAGVLAVTVDTPFLRVSDDDPGDGVPTWRASQLDKIEDALLRHLGLTGNR